MMFKFNKKNYLLALVSIFVCLLFLVVLIRPKNNHPESLTDQIERVVKICSNSDTVLYYGCFRRFIEPFVINYGVSQVIDVLNPILIKREPAEKSVSCHDLSHLVGEVGINNGLNLGETLASCTTSCEYGCLHGALTGGLKKNPDLLNNLDTVCQSFYGDSYHPQEKDACEHGLGHAVSEFTGMSLPESLSLCDRLTPQSAKNKCAEGVFMQITDYPSIPYFKIEGSISDFCKSLTSSFRGVCYETASLHEYGRGKSTSQSLAACLQVPGQYYSKCLISLVNLLYSNFQGSPEKIITFCEDPSIKDFNACLKGAIEPNIISDPNAAASLILCGKSENAYKQQCFKDLGQRYQYVYGLEKRIEFCDKFSPEFKKICLMNDE